MKRVLHVTVIITMLSAVTPSVQAGPGHDHSHGHSHAAPKILNDAEVLNTASDTVKKLVELKRPVEGNPLDTTWLEVTDADRSIHKKGTRYHIISMNNTNAGKTLYLVLSTAGVAHDANFSGNFPGLTQ